MGDINQLTDDIRRPSLAAIAAAVHNVVSTAELMATGLSREQIRHLVAIGFLYPIHRGVYVVGRPHLNVDGRCRAAWLACGGEGSGVSHISALAAHNICRQYGKIHVSGPRSLRGHPGLIVHRPRFLPPADIQRCDGYDVTTVARTIVDTAPGHDVETVGKWIHEAEVQGVFDGRQLWACLERRPGQPGNRIVEAALALEVLPTRSNLEEDMWRIWRRAGMPPAAANFYVETELGLEEVDGWCPSLNLVIEVDGTVVHRTRWRKRRDAAKDARVRATGKAVERVPELAITLDPDGVANRFRELAANRGLHSSADRRQAQPTA